MLRRQTLDPVKSECKLKIDGCSAHSVPSLSHTAMRSAGGTKSLFALSVTDCTNDRMRVFTGPSFHDARA